MTRLLALVAAGCVALAAAPGAAQGDDWRVGSWAFDADVTRVSAGWETPPVAGETGTIEVVFAADGSYALAVTDATTAMSWGTWEPLGASAVALLQDGNEPVTVTFAAIDEQTALFALSRDGRRYGMRRATEDVPGAATPIGTACDLPAQAWVASRSRLVGTWVVDYVRSTDAATGALPEPQRRMAARIAAETTGTLTFADDGTLRFVSSGPEGTVVNDGTWSVVGSDGPRLSVVLDEDADAVSATFDFINPRCVVTWREGDGIHLFLAN